MNEQFGAAQKLGCPMNERFGAVQKLWLFASSHRKQGQRVYSSQKFRGRDRRSNRRHHCARLD